MIPTTYGYYFGLVREMGKKAITRLLPSTLNGYVYAIFLYVCVLYIGGDLVPSEE